MAEEAKNSGMITFGGHCYDRQDPMPFAPFVEILNAALEGASNRELFRALLGSDASEISRLLPQLRRLFEDIPLPMELAPSQSQWMLFNAVGAVLARMAADNCLLLVLEDLHWADTGSLALVGHLARLVPRLPLLILGTYRDDELAARNFFTQTLEELIRSHLIEQVNLRGLSPEKVAEMVRSLTKREPSPALTARLHQITDGNPFFISELIRHLAERSLIDNDSSIIADIGLTPLDLPQSLRLVLARRLERISNESREILGAAAVLGRSFPISLLGTVTDKQPDDLLDLIEEAEDAHLLTSTLLYPEAQSHFVHELIRQAVLNDLSALRQQRLHLQIADAIELQYPNTLDEWTDELAHHLWEAGLAADTTRTLNWLKTAARRAMAQGAYEAATRLFKRSLEVLRRLPHDTERSRLELRLSLRLISSLIATMGYTAPEVEAFCTRANELCQTLGNIPERFAVLGRIYTVYFNRDQLKIAIDLAEQMMTLAQASQVRHELVWAHCVLGIAQHNMGELFLARQNLERVIELYEREHNYDFPQDPGVTGIGALAHVLFALGYADQALTLSNNATALARELANPYTLALSLGHNGLIYSQTGNFSRAQELMEEMIKTSRQHGFMGLQALGNNWFGWILVEHDKVDEGLARVQFSLNEFATIDPKMDMLMERFLLAHSHRKSGRPDTGLEEVTKLQALTSSRGRYGLDPELFQLKGELLLLQNPTKAPEAEQCFRNAIRTARRQSAKMIELTSTTEFAGLLASSGRRHDALAMLSGIYDWFTEGFGTPALKRAKEVIENLA